jgi:putative alpha-1,2-mannosidase
VRAKNFSPENGYVGSVTLNGKPLNRTFIRHGEILAGGELVFTMQATPNTNWGKAPADRPYTQTAY